MTNGRQPAASGRKKKATHTRGRSVVLPYPKLGMDVMTWELMYVRWLKTAKVFSTLIPSKVHEIYVVYYKTSV